MNDSVMVFGGFDFIGFQLCKKLLEEGFEVICVPSETEIKETQEMKMLELGRNANFRITEKWPDSSLIEEVNVIIVDMYSLHLKKELGEISKMYEKWLGHISQSAGRETDMVVLLPVHDCFHDLARKKLEDHINDLFFFYLPTIYGEWQPEEFVFQQAILKENGQKNDIAICERECTEDAIYVSHAMNAVQDILKKRLKGEWLIQNKHPDQWKKCASMLSISKEEEDSKSKQDYRELLKHIKIEFVDADEIDCLGLKKQKQHSLIHRQ